MSENGQSYSLAYSNFNFNLKNPILTDYNISHMYVKESPINLKKGKTEITLALGIGSYNPDESKNVQSSIPIYKPWLKYEDHWYFIKNYSRYNSLSDIARYFNNHKYTEEIFLECIFEHI